MALPQAIVQNVGGTIYFDAPVRPGVAPTVTLRMDTGAVIVAAAAAVRETVDTTIAVAAAVDDRTLQLASNAGVVAGRRYRVGPATPSTTTEPFEWVRIVSVDAANQVTLRAPLKNAHALGVSFASTRLEYTATAGQAASLFWDGHAEWALNNTAHPSNIWTGLECVLRPLHNLCTEDDVTARDGRIGRRLLADQDPRQMIDQAFDDMLEELGGAFRVRTMIGSDGLVRVTAIRVLWELAQQLGDEKGVARWGVQLQDAMAALLATRPADLNQDGIVESHEAPPGFGQGRVDRG